MPQETFIELLREVGALKQGHFLLSSGRHSDQYVEKFDLLRQPQATEEACRQLIELLGPLADVELVVGPTTGGILLAFEIGRQLGLPAAYSERAESGSNARVIKRGTVIRPGTSVLVVDDILTTGGSVWATLASLEVHDVDVRAVAMLVDRTAGQIDFGPPLVSLASFAIESWPADQCPLCAEGAPLVKPGTTDLAPSVT
ncbi:orotate phosphoribosyltransferase [soil metagenome]